MTNGIKGFLSNPIASYTAARQPGGFLAPTENFQGFLSDPRTSIGIQIAQGVPIGQALLGGALQAKQIEDVMSPVEETVKPFSVYDTQTQQNVLITPLMYASDPERYGPEQKPSTDTKKVLIDDPNDPNYKKEAYVNVLKLNDTYDDNGIQRLKYIAADSGTAGTPFYAYDKENKTIKLIKPELAVTNPGKYIKVSQKYADAFAADSDGIFTQEEFRAVGDPMQVYDTKTNKLIENMTTAEFNFRKQQGQKNPDGPYGKYADGTYAITTSGVGQADVLSKNLAGNIGEARNNIENQLRNTRTLVDKVSRLAEHIAENPEAAVVGIGPITTFIEGTKSLLETLDLASDKTFNEFIDNAENTISRDSGRDWAEEIFRVSTQYQVQQSQIKDLAYIFAAARGQEGRGLSDKDWANALQIVSGGVNAEQKLAVMQSVVNGVRKELEAKIQLTYSLAQLDPEYDEGTLTYYSNILDKLNILVPDLSTATINEPIINDTLGTSSLMQSGMVKESRILPNVLQPNPAEFFN